MMGIPRHHAHIRSIGPRHRLDICDQGWSATTSTNRYYHEGRIHVVPRAVVPYLHTPSEQGQQPAQYSPMSHTPMPGQSRNDQAWNLETNQWHVMYNERIPRHDNTQHSSPHRHPAGPETSSARTTASRSNNGTCLHQ